MKKMFGLILIFIFPILSFANPDTDKEIDDQIIYHTFSGDWQKADSLLELQIKKYPDSPKYYALKGPYYFYTRYYNGGVLSNDSLIQKMDEYSRKAIEVGEKDDMSLDDKFFVGTAYGYLSRSLIRQSSYWATYSAASKSVDYK